MRDGFDTLNRVSIHALGVIFVLLVLLGGAGLFLWWTCSESVCFFNPTIDTEFAKGYSEQAFDTVYVGMSSSDVKRLLGPPLDVYSNATEAVWQYTLDSKCSWGDFAWFKRELMIRNGRVVSITKCIMDD